MKQTEDYMTELIEEIARMNQTTPDEVWKEMQEALDQAFEDPDPETRKRQQALFGDQKPSADEFISGVAGAVEAAGAVEVAVATEATGTEDAKISRTDS